MVELFSSVLWALLNQICPFLMLYRSKVEIKCLTSKLLEKVANLSLLLLESGAEGRLLLGHCGGAPQAHQQEQIPCLFRRWVSECFYLSDRKIFGVVVRILR
jgi:hypothetical protein